ncbi:MAG: DNA-deoxyinosine glycosylase [Nevskia sp.]
MSGPRGAPVQLASFPPLEPAAARLLILGSMPGAASLKAVQYYAHPYNRFWPFMEAVFGVPRTLPYEARVRALTAQDIAVWDVLKHCQRPGSLDAHIVRGSEQANDFAGFIARHPALRAIALNGRAAEALFRRVVVPELGAKLERIALIALPSTSPANAGLRDEAKLAAWSALTTLLQ